MAKSCQGLGIGRPRLKVGIRTGELYHKLSESPWELSPRSSPCLCSPGGTAPFLHQQGQQFYYPRRSRHSGLEHLVHGRTLYFEPCNGPGVLQGAHVHPVQLHDPVVPLTSLTHFSHCTLALSSLGPADLFRHCILSASVCPSG